jgi:oligopeptidase B
MATHGHERIDEYYWLRDRSNPGVIEYIEAENRYASEMMKHTEKLQQRLFEEMKGRTSETDETVPATIDGFLYYTRTEKGRQYRIHCRKFEHVDDEEEIVLDENEVAQGSAFFKAGLVKPSPDHTMLMYLADTDGSERHTLFVKDLRTGELLSDRIANTHDAEWANDSRTIFYSTMGPEYRPDKVWRHELGRDPKGDELVYHERDPAFYYMEVTKTKSLEYILVTVESATTSEVHYLPADRPMSELRLFCPRKPGVAYFVLHWDGRFYIVTNEDAVNFKIMEAPASDHSRGNWKELVPHRERVAIDVSDPHPWVELFKGYLVVFERENAQGRIRVYRLKDMGSYTIEFPERLYFVMPVHNPDPTSTKLRVKYWSWTTPTTIYDFDLETRFLDLRKRDIVPGHNPSMYASEMLFAKARDGTRVPLSVVYRKGLRKDGSNPCFLYGYGAYGTFEWSTSEFDKATLSLLERGFVCAYAHIRGGADMGRAWHREGRVLKKMNSFTDFIACAEHLVKEGYTSPKRIAAFGRSAGGLLMGGISNMRPDLFGVVVAEVPFVDGVTTMLDPSIPLTVGEFEEWGNPATKEHYDYMLQYSPYDNVVAKEYPNMLVTAGFNDSRVQYWEPLKWVAKLRAKKTDDGLVLLRTGMVEGHAGASGRYDHLRYDAFVYAFILDRMDIKD